ncbi:MAG: LysR family transcriptional regulator [Desulfobacterales bacterium]
MSADKPQFLVRNKIWIEDGRGHVVFGLGRYRMLEAIQQTGSLQAAAAQMKMSYKALWLRVRASEERMGRSLVVRRGRGSGLTPFAENLMKQFRRLQLIVHQESDELYENLMSDHMPG